jgi:multicomponent Na+:H+ antiporter subunit C
MIGFYAMIGKKNLVKKLIGMNIFQTSIILYFISIGSKKGATIPIVDHSAQVLQASQYINPLPHVLMLTAIVVMVSTFGVAIALLLIIYRRYHTLEEDEILRLRK